MKRKKESKNTSRNSAFPELLMGGGRSHGFDPFETQEAAGHMKNVQLWLANNEKVRYINSFILYSIYIITISTIGGLLCCCCCCCQFCLFWQIRQNWDSKYFQASVLLNDLLSFNKWHLSPPCVEVIRFPTVQYIYTLCFKRGNHDRIQPHFGCQKITKDSIPLTLIRNPSFFSQGWNCYLSPQLVPLNKSARRQWVHHSWPPSVLVPTCL